MLLTWKFLIQPVNGAGAPDIASNGKVDKSLAPPKIEVKNNEFRLYKRPLSAV